jgi:aryl-alcohol dehydrogenase-like predicted oxidoreductase
MNYRHLGKAGIQVSELSFGSWVTFHTQVGVKDTVEMMAAAYDAGVNFFDNAEAYANGKSEEIMGEALERLGWRRGSYLVSTKLFWGMHDNPNETNTLNRKYLLEASDAQHHRAWQGAVLGHLRMGGGGDPGCDRCRRALQPAQADRRAACL